MTNQRRNKYTVILDAVKNSPIKTIEFEGNIYHFKLDYLLPYGECHYSRVFAKLIYLKECLGIIQPGDLLLETTSGSGGRAAAAIATALGYRIKIAVPAGGEKAREQAIIDAGSEICLTPKEDYVNGFPEFVKSFMAKNPNAKYLNHVMGSITGRGSCLNQTVITAFESFVYETIEAGVMPDFVICPLGNGTTTLPMAKMFKAMNRDVKAIGFEAVSSAFAYRKKFPGKYERIFDSVNPELIERHNLPGTTPAKAIFAAPALEQSLGYLNYIKLVTNDYIDANFLEAIGNLPSAYSNKVTQLDTHNLPGLKDFGRTGLAGFDVAVDIARENDLQGKHFLVPVFDASWHYDN